MDIKWNKLLARQIKRNFGSVENLPPELLPIMLEINNSYDSFDDDTKLLQNSIEISSQELRDAFQKQKLQAASLIAQERSLFRTIIDLIPDAVYVKDLSGRKTLANPREVQFSGKNSEDEIIGKTDFELIPEIEANRSQKEDRQVLEQGKAILNIDGQLIDKDGNIHWVLGSKVPLHDQNGNITGLVGVTRDITERKKVENELRQVSARLELATRAGGVGVWDLDLINCQLIWDDQMLALYGTDRAGFNGTYEGWLAGIHPKDVELVKSEIEQALRGEKEFDTEFSVLWPDGSAHTIRALAIVQRDGSGKPLNMIGTNWDITDQKKIEATLVIAKEEADTASQAKSEFLANMSHEIRTPLNGIIGFTELLLKTPLNKIQQQYVENANISGHSLLAIINDILDFSKIEAGKMDLDLVKTDIRELAGQSADIVKYHASKKGLELLLDIQHDIPRFAVTDPIRLKQILVNLLGNAVKFTESGEVELKVSFTETDETRGNFIFEVRDTGIGISEEQQKQLFKAFTQADTSTTRKFGGTGLGLTISSMLAEKMDSRIDIKSKPGEGSSFMLTMPAEYIAGEEPDFGSPDGIRRVLAIDDNARSREILENTFNFWGIESEFLENGLSALNFLGSRKPFDVIIVDYHMPYHNGIETISMIREQLNLNPEKQAIVLLHDSSDDIQIHEECKKLGVKFALAKPVKSQELLCYLRTLGMQPGDDIQKGKLDVSPTTVDLPPDKFPVILVAEDVPMNRLLATILIKQMVPNVTVMEAKSGREAAEMALSINPDLILMDVQMPELSGIEATLEIRAHEQGLESRIPIVALTAGAIKGEKERCLEAGMDGFLTKPVDRDALFKILIKHLS